MHSSHGNDPDHGPSTCLARSELGAVTLCDCGVVTLTMQCVSVRLELGALHELMAMLDRTRTALAHHGASDERPSAQSVH